MTRFLSNTLAAGLLLVGGQALSAPPPAYKQEVVVAGSPFQGVHGLALDGKGHLLASNLLGQSVHSIDLSNGAVSTLVGPPLGGADDVALGPDGSIYWTGFFSGQLMRRTPEGKTRVIAKDLPGLNSLAFRRDGRLYVTQLGRGADVLSEVDPNGRKPPRKILSGHGFLNGFEFGPDDRLYGPLLMKGQVVRIDVDAGTLEPVAQGFAMPVAANFDASRENLYVLDSVLGQLVRVRVATGEKTVVAKLPTGLDNLTVGPDDQVYVSNMVDNDIHVVTPADGSIRKLVEARLSVPSGLALAPDDPDENLYVADVYALRRVGGRDGKISQTARVLSSRMTFPMHVSLGAKHVVLSSAYLAAVQVLDRTSGEVLRTIPNTNGVQGVLELADGTLLVAEGTTGRLVRVEAAEAAGSTVLTEGLEGPVGLVADTEAKEPGVYVTEVRSGRVTRVRLSDGARSTVAKGLKAPEGLARHPDGGLIVAEVGRKQLVRIDPATGRSTVIASGLRIGLPESGGFPPGYIPTGVAVGQSGTIYLSSDMESALYRFVPESAPVTGKAQP
ncbi:DNA-binding beta-propeller fold protein YncE [Archangium gephyra]|uniref:DNA-binding beta-propeller fold protein YncE n=1 Tax=Archangium gephyra TaxID=48 RepID=A0AAC8Q3C8_9BACT|nr:SMP-30/gluconolactonase/LRE family protein [Archangium gephyra]AKJ00385.1 NHL repeat domain protein [Archangium gephyra]REG32918.1 DNA-binding beta-propeller fold protein YncE [Archangium gephyra]